MTTRPSSTLPHGRAVETRGILLADDEVVERLLAGRSGDLDGVIVRPDRRILGSRKARRETVVREEIYTPPSGPSTENYGACADEGLCRKAPPSVGPFVASVPDVRDGVSGRWRVTDVLERVDFCHRGIP